MSAGHHRKMANATAFAAMCRLLHEGPHTQAMLMERCGLAPYTVVKWLRILRNQQLVFVSKWERNRSGRPSAFWEWGYKEPSAPRPKPMTDAEYCARYRAKKANKALTHLGTVRIDQ